MPVRRFAIDRGEPKRLTVKWSVGGRSAEVLLDGNPLVPIEPGGLRYRLPDGRPLAVSIEAETGNLDVIRDGEFLPGTRFDPHHQVFLAYATLFALAALHCLVPLLPLERVLPSLRGSLWAIVPFALAALYGMAGEGTRKRKKLALAFGLMVAGVEACGASWLYYTADVGHIRLTLLFFAPLLLLASGFDGIDALAAEEPKLAGPGSTA